MQPGRQIPVFLGESCLETEVSKQLYSSAVNGNPLVKGLPNASHTGGVAACFSAKRFPSALAGALSNPAEE
jgi:hypothetical protein